MDKKYFEDKADELLRTFTLEELLELNNLTEQECLTTLLRFGLVQERGYL